MVEEPYLVLFCGGMGGSAAENALGAALQASTLDTLDEALATGAFGGAVLVLDGPSAVALDGRLPRGVEVDVDPPGALFHFGERLASVVRRFDLKRPVYCGSGLPLVKGDELAAVANALAASDLLVVSNNYYSADLVGFVPGAVVDTVALPNNDRVLPRLLVQQAGFVNQSLPRTIANQFDLDTPGDLAVLAVAGGAGPKLQALLDASPPPTDHLERASWLFTDSQAEVLVAGRVGSSVWQYLESETACRIRMYSEERGMQSMGRDTGGEARSMLAYHLQAVGPDRSFRELSEMVNAAFIDTRPIFVHLGIEPSRADRFASDALAPAEVTDPWLRDFTAAAREATIPVVLGGSSLVTSGVQLLSEAAWRKHDRLEAEYKARGRARPR